MQTCMSKNAVNCNSVTVELSKCIIYNIIYRPIQNSIIYK